MLFLSWMQILKCKAHFTQIMLDTKHSLFVLTHVDQKILLSVIQDVFNIRKIFANFFRIKELKIF